MPSVLGNDGASNGDRRPRLRVAEQKGSNVPLQTLDRDARLTDIFQALPNIRDRHFAAGSDDI